MAKPSVDKSAKKLVSKSVKAAAKVAAIKEKKIVSAAIKDTHMAGFVNFIREQGVVGMAVGLAIGTAAGDTVKKLVTAFPYILSTDTIRILLPRGRQTRK